MRILIIEDDLRIATNIKKILEKNHYVVDLEHSAENGLSQVEIQAYDLIILDWMLPDKQGIEVCYELRKKKKYFPILMLTAKSQNEDIIEGLEKGADDYLTKPFSMDVLLARIRVLIKRSARVVSTPILEVKDLVLDTNKRIVTQRGNIVHLAPKEYDLLEYLVIHKCRVIDRMELLEHVWGERVDELSNTVDVHIRYLRMKIDVPYKTTLIKTVINKGYMLCET